jgi:hypothetical protein
LLASYLPGLPVGYHPALPLMRGRRYGIGSNCVLAITYKERCDMRSSPSHANNSQIVVKKWLIIVGIF